MQHVFQSDFKTMTTKPKRQIRATFDQKIVRVYQAYSDEIAESAIENQKFESPPFKMTRMTWIKPSFLWMMYRSNWATKDLNQKRILAIDITHEGFQWALTNSCLSSHSRELELTKEEWCQQKNNSQVRIQWDPERDIHLKKLEYRTIQVGLSGDAVKRYTNDWIVRIVDQTALARKIKELLELNKNNKAISLLPAEAPYPLNSTLAQKINISNHEYV